MGKRDGRYGAFRARAEHLIRDDEDYHRHVEYSYIDPVKHGLVRRVHDWPFSSFYRDVSAGSFPRDWAGEFDAVGEFGEASNGAIN